MSRNPVTPDSESAFGESLRAWRQRRGWSQIFLGNEAEVSARHISFLETGRAQPSREMVLKIAGVLDLPLREKNELLLCAGYAPRFESRPLDSEEIQEARRALEFILEVHEPNPAFVLDRYWDIVLWNRPQALLLPQLEPAREAGMAVNALDIVFVPGMGREQFLNWEEVAGAVLRRLRRQLQRLGSDDRLHEKWREIRSLPGVGELSLAENPEKPAPILVPMKMDGDGVVYTWYSTLAVFGATGDVTLDELVVESFFPGDDVTRDLVLSLRDAAPPVKPG